MGVDVVTAEEAVRQVRRTLVFNVKAFGAVGDGVTDDRAAIERCIAAAVATIAAGAGAVVYLPRGIYALTSTAASPPTNPITGLAYANTLGLALPVNLAARLTIRGDGRGATTIKLSDNARNAFWINQAADYDTFKNVTLEDFDVDNNNAGGRCHIVIGSMPAANTSQRRLNYADLTFRRINVNNVPNDVTGATNYKSHVFLLGSHPAALEATQTSTRRVTVEDMRMLDGSNGVIVCSFGAGTLVGGTNHYYDEIRFRRCSHEIASVPSATGSQTSFYICGSGFGDYCEIVDCYSKNVADDAIEMGSMQRVVIDRFRADNPFLVGILFRLTHALANPGAQVVTVRDSEIRLLSDFTTSGATGTSGRPVNWLTDTATENMGAFYFDRFVHTVDGAKVSQLTRGAPKELGFRFVGQFRRLVAENCRLHHRNLDIDQAGLSDMTCCMVNLFPVGLGAAGTRSAATAVVRDMEVVVDGVTNTGGGTINLYGVNLQGPRGRATVDGFHLYLANVTGGVSTSTIGWLGNVGTLELARLRRLTGTFLTVSATLRGVRVDETTNFTSAVIDACDFRNWANGAGRDVSFATPGGTNMLRTSVRDNFYNDESGYVRKSADYTMTYLTTAVGITSTASARTVTLPAISAVAPGTVYTVKDESGAAATNNITIQRAGTDTIESATSKVISTNYGSVRLYSTGAAWVLAP